MPFVGGNFQSADTIFNGAVIIVWLSSIPIGPREFSVVAEVFPVVVAVEVFDSDEKSRSFDKISSEFYYFVISVFVFWLKKYANTVHSKMILTILFGISLTKWGFFNVITFPKNVVVVITHTQSIANCSICKISCSWRVNLS